MVFELGLVVALDHVRPGRHTWFAFAARRSALDRSLSDLAGTDAYYHRGHLAGVFREISNTFVGGPRKTTVRKMRRVFVRLFSNAPGPREQTCINMRDLFSRAPCHKWSEPIFSAAGSQSHDYLESVTSGFGIQLASRYTGGDMRYLTLGILVAGLTFAQVPATQSTTTNTETGKHGEKTSTTTTSADQKGNTTNNQHANEDEEASSQDEVHEQIDDLDDESSSGVTASAP